MEEFYTLKKKPKLSIAQLARDAGVPWHYVSWRVVSRQIPAPTEPIVRGRNKVYAPDIYEKCLAYLKLCVEKDKLKGVDVNAPQIAKQTQSVEEKLDGNQSDNCL